AFAGHSLGNLILAALYQMSNDFTGAVRHACEILRLNGRVLPSTEHPVTLCAEYEGGGIARGESNIPQRGRRIRKVWLEPVGAVCDRPRSSGSTSWPVIDRPYRPTAAPGVIEALETADVIVMGPGSLYTSVVPNLLVSGMLEAIQASRALKVYVNNLMTQPG